MIEKVVTLNFKYTLTLDNCFISSGEVMCDIIVSSHLISLMLQQISASFLNWFVILCVANRMSWHAYINANFNGTITFSQSNKGQKPLLKRGEMWKNSTQNYPEKANKSKHSP
jgi:hypothetical protein